MWRPLRSGRAELMAGSGRLLEVAMVPEAASELRRRGGARAEARAFVCKPAPGTVACVVLLDDLPPCALGYPRGADESPGRCG